MSAYPQSWAYPGEEEWGEPPNRIQDHPNLTQDHPNLTQDHPNPTQTTPNPHLNLTLVESGDDARVVFALSDLLAIAQVGETAFRKSWLPALEEVAPGRISVSHGRYSRAAMELTLSLRKARDDGHLPSAWAAQRLAQQKEQSRMDEAIARADSAGAIVPVEVVQLGADAAQSLALAQSQSALANTFAGAVLARIHAQQAANQIQFDNIVAETVATQAAIQWAHRQQIKAQTFAALDAQAQQLEQAAIAQQLAQFQGGSHG